MFKERVSQSLRSLSLRFVSAVVLVQVVIAGITSTVYASNFTSELDRRSIQNALVPIQLLNDGVLEYNAFGNRDEIEGLVGQPVVNAFVVGVNGNIFFSVQSDFLGTPFQDFYPKDGVDDFDLFKLTEPTSFIDSNGDIVVAAPLVSEDRRTIRFYAFMEISNEVTIIQRNELLRLFALGGLVTVAFTSVVIYVLFNVTIFSRVRQTLGVLNIATGGNLAVRIPNPNKDEIGVLQQGTNAMIARQQEFVNTLEQRVADRTHDLTVSALIARQIATILNTKELFSHLAEQTASAFDFYQVSIFQYNPETEVLQLVAASGATGAEMLALGKQFEIRAQGLVPTAGRTQRFALSNDVRSEQRYAANPILPETRSEVSLPIIFGGQLVGVLDLQSKQIDRFQESDLAFFAAFADQIAVTFNNARLFEEAQVARELAETADKAKSAFLASTSHELRTPLNSIINLTSFVKRGVMGPTTPRQQEVLGLVMQSGQNLLSLINDVLDMSKIESGSLKLYIEDDIDITPIIDQAVNTAESLLTDRPVSLILELCEPMPLLSVDKHRFRQILINMLSNACKFTEEGTIHLNVSMTDGQLLVSVKDTGVGIADEDQDKVFEKFVQTDSGLRQGGGTGLGMPITKSLVEAHHGRIWLTSQLGVGTTFFVSIPIGNTVVPTPILHTIKEAAL